jgi:hypothetical protein
VKREAFERGGIERRTGARRSSKCHAPRLCHSRAGF